MTRFALTRFTRLLLLLPLACSSAGMANPAPDDTRERETIERRLKALAEEIRCLVCQNESLASSQAPLAQDLRNEIRLQMSQGKSDRQIMDYLVQRYGDFVRYRPAFQSSTLILWLGPFILLVTGVFIALRYIRRRREIEPDCAAQASQTDISSDMQ